MTSFVRMSHLSVWRMPATMRYHRWMYSNRLSHTPTHYLFADQSDTLPCLPLSRSVTIAYCKTVTVHSRNDSFWILNCDNRIEMSIVLLLRFIQKNFMKKQFDDWIPYFVFETHNQWVATVTGHLFPFCAFMHCQTKAIVCLINSYVSSACTCVCSSCHASNLRPLNKLSQSIGRLI